MTVILVEYASRLFLKIKIGVHKLFNFGLYKKGVKLHGVPRLLHRQNIRMESGVSINENVFLHAAGKIIIGENSTLSYGTTVLTTSYDVSKWLDDKNNKAHIEDEVIIGKNVWLSANVTILSGVEIADGVVVGAGAVVNKSLTTPDSLYAGVPAKFIKKL